MSVLWCSGCKCDRPLQEFGKNIKSKTGYQNQCNPCRKRYRTENAEKIQESQRAAYAKDSEKRIAQNKAYREKNKESISAKGKAKRAALGRRRVARPREETLALRRQRESVRNMSNEQQERHRQKRREYTQRTRANVAAKNAYRRAAKRQATVSWADKDKIREFYETSQGLSMLLGEWYHVDHIVPLTSDFVCGLHCEANLQVTLGVENISKNNRWWPDMWEPLLNTEENHVKSS